MPVCTYEQQNENIHNFLINYLHFSYGEKLCFHRKRSNELLGCNNFARKKHSSRVAVSVAASSNDDQHYC